MVCGPCWYELRPTEYAPNTDNVGTCARCGDYSIVYRVSRAEVESAPPTPDRLAIIKCV